MISGEMKLLLACVFVGSVLAVPVRRNSEENCETGQTRFFPNTRYIYRYVATSLTGVTGTTNEITGLRIEAKCEIEASYSCQRILRVSEVKLLEATPGNETKFQPSPNQESFKKDIEANSLLFTENNRRFEVVGPHISEPLYVTNIKRGILSALQLQSVEEQQKVFTEVDVSGNCSTELKIIRDTGEGDKEILKIKNLSQCTNRTHNITKLNPVPYNVNSTIQGPLNSTSFCRYIVNSHVKTVECNEIHLLRPFSYKGAGVMTNVTMNLTLEDEEWNSNFFSSPDWTEHRKSCLLYEQSVRKDEVSETVNENSKHAKALLEELVTVLPINESKPITAIKFTNLVFAIRKLDRSALRDMWTTFYNCDDLETVLTDKQCKKAQSYVIDAITQCGTVQCIQYVVEAIRDYDQVQPEDVTTLLSGMSAVRKPSPTLFIEVLDLLEQKKDLPKTMLLSLGTMIRKFCDQEPQQCTSESDTEVMDAVDFLEKQLPKHCDATPDTVDDLIISLKAIGNAGRMRSKPVKLVECSQGANYLNVSVVAIETIRRLPFCAVTQKTLKREVFGDYRKDPEVRLQAYLALMMHPSELLVKYVAEVLDEEVNIQVGAFVFSHLKQMNESVEPTYGKRLSEMIKSALKERKTPLREFNITSFKSRFMQRSYLNEESNLGFSTESHVFYHPESLFPRSAELNVTLDMWGGAFPVVETSTRLEGLEIIWEKLFGHKGYFPDNHIRGLVRTPEEQENVIKNLEKRSTDNVLDFESLDNKVNLRTMSPSALLSLKLFGSELNLFTLKDLQWLEEDDIPLADIIDLLRALSRGIDKTYTKSVLFLEESYVVPTGLGIPLNLSLNGTVVSSMHVQGKADFLNMFWGKKSAVVKGTIKPSAAIVLSGKLTLDAFHCSSGVLLNESISTSTEMQGNVTYNEKDGLKSHINVTEKPQEILNITTALFHHIDDVKTPILGVEHRNTTGICTTDVFNSTRLFGLNLCSNISIPVAWYNKTTPFFPLTGPANFSIYLNKTDPLLTHFKLEFNNTKLDEYTNKTILAISTPGASFQRKYYCNVTVNQTEEQHRFNISIGTHQENATSIDFIRVPISQAVNITVNVTSNLTAFYFHRKCHLTHKIKYGLALNLTLFNRSLSHSFFVQNDTHLWHLETNTTVRNTTDNATISALYLNTTLNLNGNMTGNVTLNVTYRPLNLTLFLRGLHNMTALSTNVTWNVSCPVWSTPILNNNMTINVTYVNTTNEYRTHVNVSSNGTQVLSCYKAYINSTERNVTVYYCNVTVLNKTSSLNVTVTNATGGIRVCHLNVTHQNRSITLNTTWMYNELFRNVSLNITYLNHSIVLSGSVKNSTLEKGICLNSTYYNGTQSNFTILATCLSFVNTTEQKSLIFNVTSLNTTATVNTTWFENSTARGILVNCTYLNQTVFNLTATYSNSTTTKNLHFNFSMGNWTAELNHTFFTTELLHEVDQIRSINITHRVRNGTRVVVNNTFTFTFFNATAKKDIVFNFTFSNRTFGAQLSLVNKTTAELLHHIINISLYTPNRTISWVGVLQNSSKVFNLTSLVNLTSESVLNHTIVWNRELRHVNVSIDILPNVTVSFNCSGTFNSSINVTANVTVYNHTLLWQGFASNSSVVSNLTMWNRTIEFVTRTCNVSHSAFFNLTTWHHFNKTAFNGSISFYINATERISYFNVSAQNVTYSWKMFSHNETHVNNTIYRINGSEIYTEWSRATLGDSFIHDVLNMTSVRSSWQALNNVTFNIPTKLANITLNMTLDGVNMTTFRTYFKYVLKNITQELLVWNYTTENITENFFNLTRHLLNVTSRSIPNVTADHYRYFHNDSNKLNCTLFYNNLAYATFSIQNSDVSLANITEELIIILQNFTDHVNTTAVLGNITNLVRNMSWYDQTFETYIYNLTIFGRNITQNFTAWLNWTVSELGNLTVANRTVNFYLRDYLPVVHNLTIEFLNGTVNFTDTLLNVSLVFRNFTHNVTEYLLNVTHPMLYNITRQILVNITGYVNSSSFLGGVVYPVWQNFTDMFNISVFNFTYELLHNLTISNTSLEWLLPALHYPVNISLSIHNYTANTTLYSAIEGLLNKTLELYNITVRTTACRVNRSHELLVNVTDFVLLVLNDTVNALNVTVNKTTQEIIELYINRTYTMTHQLFNMTLQLLTSTNFSKPLNETWEMLNLTTHFSNWTHCMPWMRPALKKWNSTMFEIVSIMRNHSWQNYTRHYFPLLVNYTTRPITMNIYLMAWFLRNFPSNTTVTNETMISTLTYPLFLRLNYTQFFLNVTNAYMNLTAKTLNFTRNMTELFLNSTSNLTVVTFNTTMNWTLSIYNWTLTVVNTTASFVNGSLVNETICHYAHLPEFIYFNMMNFSCNITDHILNYTMCWVNQTIREYVNRTISPVLSTLRTLKAISELKPEDMVELLQPQNVTGMTFGRHHVYTFDKRYFRFPGIRTSQCQFLVARDFKDGNFTILASSHSITVITRDAVVRIYRDGLVKSQGIVEDKDRRMLHAMVYDELPMQFENTTIVRDGPYINLTNDLGFSLECDMEHFLCSYNVSGFYHNRTAGILGTNNGEPSDDWLSPSGKNRTSVADFFNSWHVAGGEECKVENSVEAQMRPCERKTNRCSELFKNESSPLSECFSKVNPLDFNDACVADYTDCGVKDPEKTIHCNVTAAYIRECKRHGIEITMPDECSSCDVNGRVFKKNSTWKLEPSSDVDVVLVSSEGPGMKHVVHRLPILVDHLDNFLKNHKISPRFGLVGFSGKAPVHRPGHVHTVKGKFFSDAKDFKDSVIMNMQFAKSDKEFPDSDGFLGLMKASEYPFRPGATKLIIMVTNSPRVNHSTLTNFTVSEALKSISAKLVVIGDFGYKKAVAVDAFNMLYLKKGEYKATKWSDKLPKNDEYVEVVKQTQGVTVNLKWLEKLPSRLEQHRTEARKEEAVFKSIRNQIDKDITHCKECGCIADEVGKGRTICKTVLSCQF